MAALKLTDPSILRVLGGEHGLVTRVCKRVPETLVFPEDLPWVQDAFSTDISDLPAWKHILSHAHRRSEGATIAATHALRLRIADARCRRNDPIYRIWLELSTEAYWDVFDTKLDEVVPDHLFDTSMWSDGEETESLRKTYSQVANYDNFHGLETAFFKALDRSPSIRCFLDFADTILPSTELAGDTLEFPLDDASRLRKLEAFAPWIDNADLQPARERSILSRLGISEGRGEAGSTTTDNGVQVWGGLLPETRRIVRNHVCYLTDRNLALRVAGHYSGELSRPPRPKSAVEHVVFADQTRPPTERILRQAGGDPLIICATAGMRRSLVSLWLPPSTVSKGVQTDVECLEPDQNPGFTNALEKADSGSIVKLLHSGRFTGWLLPPCFHTRALAHVWGTEDLATASDETEWLASAIRRISADAESVLSLASRQNAIDGTTPPPLEYPQRDYIKDTGNLSALITLLTPNISKNRPDKPLAAEHHKEDNRQVESQRAQTALASSLRQSISETGSVTQLAAAVGSLDGPERDAVLRGVLEQLVGSVETLLPASPDDLVEWDQLVDQLKQQTHTTGARLEKHGKFLGLVRLAVDGEPLPRIRRPTPLRRERSWVRGLGESRTKLAVGKTGRAETLVVESFDPVVTVFINAYLAKYR